MKKHMLIALEALIKENNARLKDEPLTPLWAEVIKNNIKVIWEIKQSIENMNEVWAYTNLITCDFKEKTMTFDIPEWFQLKSGEYYIEFNK